MCVSRSHYEVTVEHLAAMLLDDPAGDWPPMLHRFGLEPGDLAQALDAALDELQAGNAGKPVFSPLLLDLLQDAWLVSSIDLGETVIRSGGVLLALLARPALAGPGRAGQLLRQLNRETLARDFRTVTQPSAENPATQPPAAPGPCPAAPGAEGGFLRRFCQDFTQKAREGGIDPVFGRDGEIRRMVDILARRRKNNPLCVGDPGVGKTAVVEGLALRISQGDVPEILREVALLGLDLGLLEAGAGVKGEFEHRLKGVIDEIKASGKPVILFIDEAHTLVGAGGTPGAGDAANLLKPALARGELRTIAATTWTEYPEILREGPRPGPAVPAGEAGSPHRGDHRADPPGPAGELREGAPGGGPGRRGAGGRHPRGQVHHRTVPAGQGHRPAGHRLRPGQDQPDRQASGPGGSAALHPGPGAGSARGAAGPGARRGGGRGAPAGDRRGHRGRAPRSRGPRGPLAASAGGRAQGPGPAPGPGRGAGAGARRGRGGPGRGRRGPGRPAGRAGPDPGRGEPRRGGPGGLRLDRGAPGQGPEGRGRDHPAPGGPAGGAHQGPGPRPGRPGRGAQVRQGRPQGRRPAPGRVPVRRPFRGRQDRDRPGPRRPAVRQREAPGHRQPERIPGEAHGEPPGGRASGLRGLRRGRPAHRGGAPEAGTRWCSWTSARRPIRT